MGGLLKTKVRAGFGQLLNPIGSQFLGGLGHLKTSYEPNGADGPHRHGLRRQDPVTGPQAETLRLFSVSKGIWKEWSLTQHPQAMPRREGSCWAMDGAASSLSCGFSWGRWPKADPPPCTVAWPFLSQFWSTDYTE